MRHDNMQASIPHPLPVGKEWGTRKKMGHLDIAKFYQNLVSTARSVFVLFYLFFGTH